MIAVLDTQGVEAFAGRRTRERARLRVLWLQVDDVVIPAAVLAEGVLTGHPGHDVGVHRLLREASIDTITDVIGLAAGALRGRALRDGGGRTPSGVDAVVAAVADRRAAEEQVVIVTSDEDDLLALAQHCSHVDRLSIERV